MLDRTGQRIVGVLIEKELSVPESYPLTENALLLGCNQRSNRDPEMSLEEFELRGALMQLQVAGFVTRREGGRADRYRHEIEAKLGVDARQKAVLAELLLRGPQTPTELKTRCARLGLHTDVHGIEGILKGLSERPQKPVVVLLPRAPREREARFGHLLGVGGQELRPGAGSPAPEAPPSTDREPSVPDARMPKPDREAPEHHQNHQQDRQDHEERIRDLERRIDSLERRLDAVGG